MIKADNEFPVPSGKGFLGGLALLVILLAVFKSYVVVESGHIGIVRTFGAVRQGALEEGLHFVRPFVDKVEQMDMRLISLQTNAASASKDLQTVQTEVTMQFSLVGSKAPLIYQKIGRRDDVGVRIIQPAVLESVKAITALFTAEQLVTKRSEVKLKIQEAIEQFIQSTLEEKDLGDSIRIANLAITDFSFSPEFDRAIELKVKAEQEALQAKNEKVRRVTQAEAGAAERRLAAEAAAYEIETASKARAEAIRREAEALKNNPELVQLRIAEKWDGKLPQFSGSAGVPLLQLPKMSDK